MSLLRRREMMVDNANTKNGLVNGYYNNHHLSITNNSIITLLSYPAWNTTLIPIVTKFNVKQGDTIKTRLNMIDPFIEFVDFGLSNGEEVINVVVNKRIDKGEFVFENTDKDYNDINTLQFLLRNTSISASFVFSLYVNDVQVI